MINGIQKVLSSNDTGETGGHQAGILVPKDKSILGFFPILDKKFKNPRAVIDVVDETGKEWAFSFIYYNNRLFGGTRNEYRLTGMTSYFKAFNLKSGDKIFLQRELPGMISITFERAGSKGPVLKLSSSWKIIETEL